jgi:hypothetical protein
LRRSLECRGPLSGGEDDLDAAADPAMNGRAFPIASRTGVSTGLDTPISTTGVSAPPVASMK